MANIKEINLFGTVYPIVDDVAQTTASQAVATANQAKSTAESAMQAVQNAAVVSYDSGSEALVFSRGGE